MYDLLRESYPVAYDAICLKHSLHDAHTTRVMYVSMLDVPPSMPYLVLPFTPDIIVMLGHEIVRLEDVAQTDSAITRYKNKYGVLPNVFVLRGSFVICAQTKDKCKDMEEILQSYLSLVHDCDKVLALEEVKFLTSWDKELYRKGGLPK
jgi:hypothetical protein